MTTVVDPAGTPSPIYNRSGVTIVSMETGGDILHPASGPVIPAVSGHTVALLSIPDGAGTNSDGYFITLPVDADVGDVVEVIYTKNNSTFSQVWVWPPSGETMDNPAGVTVTGSTYRQVSAGIFRKTSAAGWWCVSGS